MQSLTAVARLLSTLAVLEQKDGKLIQGSSSAVTAAKQLGGSITGFVAGSNVKLIAEEAAKIAGIEKIVAVENGAYDKVLESASPIQNCSILIRSYNRDYQRTLLPFL